MIYTPHKVYQHGLTYSDVYLLPQYSEVLSRKDVSVSAVLPRKDMEIEVPVISANMKTVTDGSFANKVRQYGGIGALHRFMSVEDNVKEFHKVTSTDTATSCFVSIGVNEEDYIQRAKALYAAGAKCFIVDIAHGHSVMMKNTIAWLRKNFGDDIVIMAGNISTAQAFLDVASWGADMVKVGIGLSTVCTTKNVTGVTTPQFTAVMECGAARDHSIFDDVLIVADGSVKEIGDITKALAVGADFVMCGGMFAQCQESAAPSTPDGKKVYRGSSSKEAMLDFKKDTSNLPTAEGIEIVVDSSGSIEELMRNIKGGLQSAFSYSNARNLKQFQQNAKWAIRHKGL